jgi:predicted porin
LINRVLKHEHLTKKRRPTIIDTDVLHDDTAKNEKYAGGPMKSCVKYVIALMSIATSAQAADLNASGPKDPLPDNLTWHGITLFGSVDLGAAYQSNGAPYSGSLNTGLAYNVFGNKNLRGPVASFTNNAMQQSTIGLKIDEPLFAGWKAIGQFDTGFNPLSGELSDGCKSIVQNNGLAPTVQNSFGDTIRCGQALNGNAYGGVSNATYGTLTVGRQFNLNATNLASTYDPLAGAPAFSFVTFVGGFGAGAGSAEAAIWDSAIKYSVINGPFHGGVMYTQGGDDQPLHGSSYNLDLGATWQGLTVDATYLKQHGATFAFAYAPGGCGTAATPSCSTLNGTAFDSSEIAVGAKYTFELGKGSSLPAKLTFSGAYAYTTVGNRNDPLTVGTTTIGGYAFGAINNNSFGTDKVLQTLWVGANYELANGWTFTGVYYHGDQGSYVTHFGPVTVGKCTGTSSANCAGTTYTVSGVVDYRFDKHFDVYGGISYSRVSDGLANGYLSDNSTLAMSGIRLRF